MTDVDDARAALAQRVRRAGHALVGRDATAAAFAEARGHVDAALASLEASPIRGRTADEFGARYDETWADGAEVSSYDERPVSGRSSPWGLELAMVRAGDDIVARVTLQAAHEGAPGAAHGGVVAALFDDLMGISLGVQQIAAFTGELAVRYLAATPIGRPLVCRARVTGVDGRKVFVSAELTDESGEPAGPYATATSTYITVDRDAFVRQEPTTNAG